MTSLPTGTYLERDSRVHRLDARVKLLAFVVGVVAVLLCSQWWMYVPVVVVFALAISAAGLTAREALMPLRRMAVFLLVIFVMNALFFGAGEATFFTLGPLAPSLAGIDQGAHIVVNVALILTWGSVLTMTTSPIELTSAFEFAFRPLGFIGVPVKTLALIISVAVQFIPTLLEQAEDIKKAQIARGAQFESRNVLKRAAAVVPLVVPVFVAAFRRADELSQAMEARGYRANK